MADTELVCDRCKDESAPGGECDCQVRNWIPCNVSDAVCVRRLSSLHSLSCQGWHAICFGCARSYYIFLCVQALDSPRFPVFLLRSCSSAHFLYRYLQARGCSKYKLLPKDALRLSYQVVTCYGCRRRRPSSINSEACFAYSHCMSKLSWYARRLYCTDGADLRLCPMFRRLR